MPNLGPNNVFCLNYAVLYFKQLKLKLQSKLECRDNSSEYGN